MKKPCIDRENPTASAFSDLATSKQERTIGNCMLNTSLTLVHKEPFGSGVLEIFDFYDLHTNSRRVSSLDVKNMVHTNQSTNEMISSVTTISHNPLK